VITISLLLALSALVVTIAAAIGKAPLWVAVVLLCILALVQVVPVR
jgi:hypothetical protein